MDSTGYRPTVEAGVDRIWASHVVEHVEHTKTLDILADWSRALKPGGIMDIIVPNVDKGFKDYLDQMENANRYLAVMFFVYSAAGGVFSYHQAFFGRDWFDYYLPKLGFGELEYPGFFGVNSTHVRAKKL